MNQIEELKNITIDPELEVVCRRLTVDEAKQLEANILADGAVTSPLIVWKGILLDGHNRRRIILKHPELPFTIREVDFADRYEAIVWICKNQLGRRNMTDTQRHYLIGTQYNAEKKANGASDGFRGNQHTAVVEDRSGTVPESTKERIARENGVGCGTVQRATEFTNGLNAAEEVQPGIKEEILSGAIRPAKQDVAAVAKAPIEERKAAVERLRIEKKQTQKKTSEQHCGPYNSAAEAEEMPSVRGEDMIGTIACGFNDARTLYENYVSKFPELLGESRDNLRNALQGFTDFYRDTIEDRSGTVPESTNGLNAAEEVQPGIKEEILSGTIRPAKQDVAAVAKAPEDERKQMVERIRQLKDKTPQTAKRTPSPVSTANIAAISSELGKPKEGANIESVLDLFKGAVHDFMWIFELHLNDFPELLDQRKDDFRETLQEFTEFYMDLLSRLEDTNDKEEGT